MRFVRLMKNEKGIAFVMVLVIAVVSLAVMSALIFMVTSGTQISGMGKRYLTTLECAYGANEIAVDFINSGGVLDTGGFCGNIVNTNTACMTAKRTGATSAVNWAACTNFVNATSTIINPNDPTTYDISFDCGTCRAYVKIFDTVHGNTGIETALIKGSVISAFTDPAPIPMPFGFSFEIMSVNIVNPDDNARLSFVYSF